MSCNMDVPAAFAPLNLRIASLASSIDVYVTNATPSDRPSLSYFNRKLWTGPIPLNNSYTELDTYFPESYEYRKVFLT